MSKLRIEDIDKELIADYMSQNGYANRNDWGVDDFVLTYNMMVNGVNVPTVQANGLLPWGITGKTYKEIKG